MSNVILIADDEPWQRMWLSQMLYQAGFTCSTVADGVAVVEQALALDPVLAILDIEMPGMSGLEAARQLRILPNTRSLPILFVTSYANPRELQQQSPLQHTAWLSKPFHPEELLGCIRRLLSGE